MYNRYEQVFFSYFNQFKQLLEAKPIILGGIAGSGGGIGGPPGGFVGYLPQTNVAYDLSELATLDIPVSGASLLDNLNHIRYRIDTLENVSGTVVGSFLDLTDTPVSYSGFGGYIVSVMGNETGLEFITASGVIDSLKVKVSSNDTTEDFLENKLVAGSGVGLIVLNDGGNEQIRITASGGTVSYNSLTDKPYRVMTFGLIGALSVKTLEAKLHAPFAGTIANVTATVNTAPGGASVIIDVNKGGTTIFSTQANRPTITAGNTDDLSSTPDVTSFSLNDVFTVDIDQVGTSPAGSDLVVQIRCNV